ncbi:MAG: coproporphyrinogen dehydrogenase HemZ [Clostridia bacterium]|nr:coproporphyrinogen dehydrogenase HemZ [Clostridia bacterium]
MIRIVTDEPRFFSDLGDVLRLFYGDVTVSLEAGDVVFEHHFAEAGGLWTDTWASQGKQVALSRPVSDDAPLVVKRLRKRQVKQALYELLKALTGMRPPWGSLTGIRPTRLLYEAMEAGMGLEEAVAYVIETFDVSPDRAGLLGEIAQMQEGLRLAPAGCFDLYIGIPFCKTRCSYCSFSSGEIGDGRLVAPYVDALLREIELCRAMMEQAGLRLRAGYVGGGTPTAIPRDDLERILAAAQAAFPGAVEWTVEAGRPDTIDEGKLRMLKDRGVTRISVNPQTFSDDTLARIGRAHTGQQTVEAYRLARAMGFDDVNMDIIAALPGEGVADFARTLDVVQDLAPDSVTVHSLAIKRSSRLHEQLAVAGNGYGQVSRDGAAEMIAMARRRLTGGGWKPYYLYRQKYMAGNLENVGYAKPGKACLYNIGNMEETVSVLALGAGAITKWLFDTRESSAYDDFKSRHDHSALRIERAPNVRNIAEYIARVDEMAQRKRDVILRKSFENV